MRLKNLVRVANVHDHLLRQADWVAPKNKRKRPDTGDPHPQGGVYIYRISLQGVRDALPFLVNEGVRIGRVKKLGLPSPGQLWVVEVYKPGAHSPARQEDGSWQLNPDLGADTQALVVHTQEDQLTWTGDVYDSFEEALTSHRGTL